jgi:hypothetical protein
VDAGPACPALVAYADCVPRSPPAPCGRLARPPRTLRCADSPWSISRPLCDRVGLPVTRPPWGLPRAQRFSLCLPGPEDPDRPSGLLPSRCRCRGCRCVQTVAVCVIALTRLSQTSGCAVPLPASSVPWARFPWFVRQCTCLRHRRNTRYGWWARPSPVGTFTPRETPSFTWRTNARPELRLEAGATKERTLFPVALPGRAGGYPAGPPTDPDVRD